MKKLNKRWQLFLYAASGMGVNMMNLMMGSYLCSALLTGGFGEAAIPYQTYLSRDLVIAGVWSVFVLIAKIIDGVIDIPMASFTDRLRTRWGRRRPALVIGMVPMILSYVLFLAVPQPEGATLLNTIYYGVMLCIFYSFYTLTMVTYYATYTEIVDNERDRTTISNVKSVFDILYFILGYVVVRMLLNGLNIRVVALITLPLVLTMLIPLFMIREPSTLDGKLENGEESVNLIRSLACTFKNKNFIIWMVVYAFMTFGVQLFLGGINEYFSYVGMNMMFVMLAAFAPVPLTLMLYNRILYRWGFGVAFRYTLILFSVGMLLMFGVGLMPQGTPKMIASIGTGLVSSLAIGSLFAVAYSVPSQLAADEEQQTGISNSAMYFAVQGLFSGVATGIGAGVVLTALKTQNAITYLTLISAAGTLIAFIFTFFLPASVRRIGLNTKKKAE